MRKKIIIALIIAAIAGSWYLAQQSEEPKLRTPEKSYRVILRDTPEERIQGLSGMDNLPKKTVMLFAFEKPDYPGIWMKDMRFPIDIVFLDENYTVTAFYDQVAPETYPTIFYPETLSQYVIEMSAGERTKAGLDKGVQVYYK